MASRSDVELGQVYSLASKIRARYVSGEVVEIGEYFVGGNWVKIGIPARR